MAEKHISIEYIGDIKIDPFVTGIAKLQNNIYILVYRSIQIYNDQSPFVLQKEINVKEIDIPYYMASCEKQQCLYIINYGNYSVWKITPSDNRVTKWLEGIGEPWKEPLWTLSVSSNGHVLIPRIRNQSYLFSLFFKCFTQDRHKFNLELYSTDASLIRRILLPDFIVDLSRAVMTSKGNFIISHRCKDSNDYHEWSISEVNKDGQIVNHFKSDDHSLILFEPYYMSLYSCDYFYERVICLAYDLEFSRTLLNPDEEGIHPPRGLFYDSTKNKLLVSSRHPYRFRDNSPNNQRVILLDNDLQSNRLLLNRDEDEYRICVYRLT